MPLTKTITTGWLSLAAIILLTTNANAQLDDANTIPNLYETVNPGEQDWVSLPNGRSWGATSTVYSAGDGYLWAAERCGANGNCLDTPDIDPVLL